jgi:serine/threonine protein kinase
MPSDRATPRGSSSDSRDAAVEPPTSTGSPPKGAHPGFATTAFGPADVRDTPRVPAHDAPRSEPPDPWIGRVLSNVYRVETKIGEGGMGSVYAARHVHLGKQYAVKVLSATIATNATAIERLKQEAIAASSIDHDNIVQVISFDRYADGAVFIVMEYLRGESLAARLERGPIPLHLALAIAHQIAAALGAAHARDIVHRDLKPENVFLARRGQPDKAGVERAKVLDFGISKVKSADAEQVKMTRTGQLVGTPLYMSPEQARGETEIDRRVDVYALGVILYEMLTGAPPFEGRNYFELLWKHGNEPPTPPKHRNPNVHIPDEVEAVVLRALAKRREDRFESMEALSAALLEAAPDVALPHDTISVPPRTGASGSPSQQRVTVSGPPILETDQAKTTSMPAPWAPRAGGKAWGAIAAISLALITVTAIAIALAGGQAARSERAASERAALEERAEVARRTDEAARAAEAARIAAEAAGVRAAAEEEARRAREEEASPVPDPLDSIVEIAVDSIPAGAEVRLGDRVLGTTPLFADVEAGPDPIALVFHREGYVDETERLVPSAGARVTVRLRRRGRGASTDQPGSSLIKKVL